MPPMHLRPLIVTSLAVALASCGPQKNDPAICSTFAQLEPAELLELAWSAKLENCLHKWSYRLAKSDETAPVVAAAAIGGCKEALANSIGEKVAENRKLSVAEYNSAVADARKAGEALPSYSDYEPPSFEVVEKQARDDAQKEALFRVTQARAGNCDVP
jgi:hypothetical protein